MKTLEELVIYIQNSHNASALTLFLAHLFGTKIITYDEYKTYIVLKEWRGKTYFMDFIPQVMEF